MTMAASRERGRKGKRESAAPRGRDEERERKRPQQCFRFFSRRRPCPIDRLVASPPPSRFLFSLLSRSMIRLFDLSLTLSALRSIPSFSWHSARLTRALARRREEVEDDEEEEEAAAPSPLDRSSAEEAFFALASSPAIAASRIRTAEARSPACRASTSAEVGAIARAFVGVRVVENENAKKTETAATPTKPLFVEIFFFVVVVIEREKNQTFPLSFTLPSSAPKTQRKKHSLTHSLRSPKTHSVAQKQNE